MFNFGALIYRGPLVADPQYANEPDVAGPPSDAASGTDHAIFIGQVAQEIIEPEPNVWSGLAAIGAARFTEDYLAPAATQTDGYRNLLDTGLAALSNYGQFGLSISPEVLTQRQQQRLTELQAKQQPSTGSQVQ
jgi:hypothetical protein